LAEQLAKTQTNIDASIQFGQNIPSDERFRENSTCFGRLFLKPALRTEQAQSNYRHVAFLKPASL
jgi:hypothetical protein